VGLRCFLVLELVLAVYFSMIASAERLCAATVAAI